MAAVGERIAYQQRRASGILGALMRTLLRFSTLLVFLSLCQADWTKPAAVEAQTVRAVLFYAPGCPHCRHVISQDLPVFFEIYGGPPRVWVNESAAEEDRVLSLASNGELEILLVDASLPVGAELYQASMLSHPVTPERDGVPRLVIGDTVLVGAVEIPARFHGLIGQALATGGAAWPAITGLEEIIAAFPGASIAAATEGKPVSPPVITDEGESAAADTVQRVPGSGSRRTGCPSRCWTSGRGQDRAGRGGWCRPGGVERG